MNRIESTSSAWCHPHICTGNHRDSTITSSSLFVLRKGIKNNNNNNKKKKKQAGEQTKERGRLASANVNAIASERRIAATSTSMRTDRSAKTPLSVMAPHDVPNSKRDAAAKSTCSITMHGVGGYISSNDTQRDLCTRQFQSSRQTSSIILNSSLSDDDSSSLTTIDDSLTTLDGLNIDLSSSSPHVYAPRYRSVKFKRVSFLHTYSNSNCHPSFKRPTPAPVRKLDLYEKIALYEQRPDLAPIYYVGGISPSNLQIATATATSSNIEEMILAPVDEAKEVLQIGRTWKPRDAFQCEPMVAAADETIVSVGSTDAVANFNYRDNVPYDEEEEETRGQGDYSRTHCRVADALSMSLLDVASGSDGRDDDDDDDNDETHAGNVRDECPSSIIGGDMTRICRIYGPRAVGSIIGCVVKGP